MHIEGSTSAAQSAAAAAKAAAEAAAKAAAKAAAEAAAKAAAEAAAKAAAEAAAKAMKDKPTPASGLSKLKEAAQSAVDALPWEKAGSLFTKVKEFVSDFVKADGAKDEAFIAEHGNALGPAGRENLAALAANGTLSAIDKGWGSLRNELGARLSQGGDPKLVEGIVNQLAHPEAIQQVNDNTCTAATLQKSMAQANPAQYAAIAHDLAAKGEATLPNGEKLVVSKANQEAIAAKDFTPEQRINAAFQAAAMDYANGQDAYDLANDRSSNKTPDSETSYAGLNVEQAAKLNEALLAAPTVDQDRVQAHMEAGVDRAQETGEKVTVFGLIHESVTEQFEEAKEAGAPGVFITLHAGSESVGPPQLGAQVSNYHMVMIKDMDDEGNATLVDANGAEFTMGKDQLANAVSMSNEEDAHGGIGNLGTMYGTSGSRGGRGR